MTGPGERVPIGMVHGRFQPFHLGHLEYFRQAAASIDGTIFVGITNPGGATGAHPSDDHRHRADANPYSYLDRARMIDRSFTTELEVHIVPFDVQSPQTWGFIPKETVQFVSVLEEWDRVKVRAFRDYGFEVRELEASRVTSGADVRHLFEHGRGVEARIPTGTRDVLTALEH